MGKGVHQGCMCIVTLSHRDYLTYMQCIMRNAGLNEAQLESRFPGEISITSDKQITSPLWQKQRTKEPLDESERGE